MTKQLNFTNDEILDLMHKVSTLETRIENLESQLGSKPKQIVKVYKNKEGRTLRATFNTNGFGEVSYRKDTNWYSESDTEIDFQNKMNREGWKVISVNGAMVQ